MPPPTTVSVPIRLGRTTTRIKDSVKIHANVDVGLTNASTLRVCAVCHENESKYTCPRCNAVYCGVPCYKTHGSSCTEQFYKGHVESEMRLNKTSDTVREMQEMLQRVHDEFPETSPLDARIDDLVELLENNSLTLDKLTQEERTNFLREVADGRLGKFITLWEPWWMQSIAAYESTTQGLRQSLIVALDGIDDESDDFDGDVTLRHPIGLFTNTLQAKLPPTIFDLHPSPNHEALECNLVDILFAYSFVMRMYNGDWRVDVLEAGALCISSSAVLQGKAHAHVLGQVVFACRAQTRIADADAAAKNAALVDVTSILGQRLFILDSLCDLLLLVESMQAEGASKKKKDLNRVAKKVEFHIVWAKDAVTSMRFPRLQQQLIQAIDQATPTS